MNTKYIDSNNSFEAEIHPKYIFIWFLHSHIYTNIWPTPWNIYTIYHVHNAHIILYINLVLDLTFCLSDFVWAIDTCIRYFRSRVTFHHFYWWYFFFEISFSMFHTSKNNSSIFHLFYLVCFLSPPNEQISKMDTNAILVDDLNWTENEAHHVGSIAIDIMLMCIVYIDTEHNLQ